MSSLVFPRMHGAPRHDELPVVVIGAGPVGLAAAAHLVARGRRPIVVEAGLEVGASVRAWGHVKMFSPWKYDVDETARALLVAHGWQPPADEEAFPTGRELAERYLEPLAQLPAIAERLRVATRVVAVTRRGTDKRTTAEREAQPFVVRLEGPAGEERVLARAVIDASGTYHAPNPMGADGVPAIGERAHADRIFYGIPDVLGAHRARYEGKHVLVVGSGHSAFNALLDLETLARTRPGTRVTWAIRRARPDLGGGTRDELAARGALGDAVRRLLDGGRVELRTRFAIDRLERTGRVLRVHAGDEVIDGIDEIVAATGFRPDVAYLRELRLGLDAIVESPTSLAPLIDPNVHSCGSVPPHGAFELAHPEEPGFFIVGMKSYGRAPTFLLLTGYEQARSVVALLDGDEAAAREVRLVLPETGVCKLDEAGAACCAPAPAPAAAAACCGPAPAAAATPGCCG